MSARKVFGRLRNVETSGGFFTFELTKDGLKRRERNKRSVVTISFEILAHGAFRCETIDNDLHFFRLTPGGLEVWRKGSKKRKMVPFATLANAARDQMEMFPEVAK